MAQGLKKGNKGRKKGKVSQARPRKRGRDGRIKGRVKGKTVGATTKPGPDKHLNNIWNRIGIALYYCTVLQDVARKSARNSPENTRPERSLSLNS